MLPRNLLPQIPNDKFDDFREYMENNDISSKLIRLPGKYIKPIQSQLNKDKIKKIISDGEVSNPLIISYDNYLLDGHHRWAAELVKNINCKIICLQFNCPITKLLELGHLFDGSFVRSISEASIYIV